MAQANRHESAPVFGDKVQILPGATEGFTQATFCILEEDHTLGNLLRWMLMKNPAVEFCGYSAPHPSEAKIHLRVQMYDGKSAVDALHEALNNVEDMAHAILDKYNESLEGGDFARVEDETHDFESVNARLWAQKEAQGKGSYDEFLEEKRRKDEAEAAEAAKKRGKAVKR
ncbi:RNA polymerase subunit AC19 [Rhodotorula kratochvilovae]